MVCLAISSYSFGATALIFCRMFIHIMEEVQLPVILRIFEENQKPVDMLTSIMCINILKNIKAIASKLGGDSRTNHVSISGQGLN
jgi:hypothetical protein